MSWEDYERYTGPPHAEYVDGHLVMAPPPTRAHQQISRQVANLLEAVLPEDFLVVEAWGWKPGTDQFVPDVMVTPVTDEDLRFTGVPLLVVEVLSTNRTGDLVRKSQKYAAAGAPHYWIVDPRDRVLTAFDLRDGVYEEAASLEDRDSGGVPLGEFRVPVDLGRLIPEV